MRERSFHAPFVYALMRTKTFCGLLYQRSGSVRSEATLWLERFALGGVVRHEQLLDLVDEVLVQVVERLHVLMVAGVGGESSPEGGFPAPRELASAEGEAKRYPKGDCEQAIVALGEAFFGLLGIKAAN